MILIGKLISLYKGLLKNNLVLVQAMQTGVLCGTGDVIAQMVAEKKSFKDLNLQRTGIFLVLGTGFIGPAITIWYKFLSRTIGEKGKYAALKKVALDQLLFVPPFQVSLIAAINLLQGHNLEFAKDQIKLKLLDILITGYKIWPPVQIVNFYFVPLSYQVLVVQFVALFWNSYLSWKTQLGVENRLDK